MTKNQESAIQEAQCEATWKCVEVKKNELINTQFAVRIMAFILAAMLTGCASSQPDFLPQSCEITNCGKE
jgi:hypothetical protein